MKKPFRYLKFTEPLLFRLDFQKVGCSTAPNTAKTISCKAWNSPVEYTSK